MWNQWSHFLHLKVLTQSAGHFNGSPNGRRAVWRWAAVPVCCKRACGSAVPHLDRHPFNFMLYLRTLHILCLLCQTSFLQLIRQNGKYLTAAQISVISLWNRFRNGNTGGPAVTTCRSDICQIILDHNIIWQKKGNSTYSSMWTIMSSIPNVWFKLFLSIFTF